jgi:dolichol-phosphate mannosyltransferase
VDRWALPRRAVSRVATRLAGSILRLRVRDPLSGFFAIRREMLVGAQYVGRGYKLLLEVLVRHPRARVVEVPYRFVDRRHGRSKLSPLEVLNFLKLLIALRVGSLKR